MSNTTRTTGDEMIKTANKTELPKVGQRVRDAGHGNEDMCDGIVTKSKTIGRPDDWIIIRLDNGQVTKRVYSQEFDRTSFFFRYIVLREDDASPKIMDLLIQRIAKEESINVTNHGGRDDD